MLVVQRFDRDGRLRIPFLSAMSVLGPADHETRSYLEIADSIQACGASPKRDLSQLWRRVAFTILMSNTDDHLCNHGFLCQGVRRWRLSPAHDMNPVPTGVSPSVLFTTIDANSPSASLELAFATAAAYSLAPAAACGIAGEVGRAVSAWRNEARGLGLRRSEIEEMAPAFEHRELDGALRI